MQAQLLNRVQFFATPWPVSHQAPLSMPGILQARILEWVAISYSKGSSQPRNQTRISSPVLAGMFFIIEPPWEPYIINTLIYKWNYGL